MKSEIIKYDPEFTESNFKTFVDNVFIQIHLAIMTKEIEKVKHFMSDELYASISSKVENLKNSGHIQMFDEINVKSSEITNVFPSEDKIIVEVSLISRYMDYLLDENGNFVSGNNTSRVEKMNILKFAKNNASNKLNSVRKCPGCGASIDVNANGKCAYCDTTFNLEDSGWILVELETR